MQNTLSENSENSKPQSQFYWFHMKHDEKKQSLDKRNPLDSRSHSERLAEHLKDLIKSNEVAPMQAGMPEADNDCQFFERKEG